MTVKNLFIFAGIACLLFGVVFMVHPATLVRLFFTRPAFIGPVIGTSRNYGILLTAVGIATIAARNSFPSTARRGYLIQCAIAGILFTVYDSYAIFKGVYTNSAWGVVALTAIIGIWGLLMLYRERTISA